MFGRLKDRRRIATRHDRCPKVFLSAIALAATVIFWPWDVVTGPASRAARYRLQDQGKLSPFPYRIHTEGCGRKLLVGLDVSLEKTAICVISEHGRIVREAQVASEPEALVRWLGVQDGSIAAIGLEALIRDLAADNPMLVVATEPMLRARASRRQELAGLERRVRQLAQDDPVCLRVMSLSGLGPGIGAVVALTFRSAVDDPARFTSSKKVGPWVGLTPSRTPSGERDVSGGITKAGDVTLRRALCQAATVMMHRGRATWLRTWAAQVARRRGRRRALVALARRIGVPGAFAFGAATIHRIVADRPSSLRPRAPVTLHRMWCDGTVFRIEPPVTAHAA